MAQLDIERKQGSSWLWWLLGIIVLALLIWWVVSLFDNDNEVAAGDVVAPAAVATAPAAAPMNDMGTITSLDQLTSGDMTAMAGRHISLNGVPVENVVSDKGFWVGNSPTQHVFAVRNNQMAQMTPPDGAVNQGQTVNLAGTVMAMPADLTQSATEWNLKSTDTQALGNERVYIQVDSLTITSGNGM